MPFDDLLFSKTVEDHLKRLEYIFSKFLQANLMIKLRKSEFARKEVIFFGHIISSEGIVMDPNRIKAIQDFPTPRNIRELRGFLGMVNYDFVKIFQI